MEKKDNFLSFFKALSGGDNDRKTTIVILVITIVNIILTFLKAGVSFVDGSMSIASSALESFGDVFACFVIGYNRYKEQTADPKKYPRGRNARAQGYNICAYIMITVAFGSLLIEIERFLVQKIIPSLDIIDLAAMAFNIFCKGVLWFICFRSSSSELVVLKMDQQNDIINNTVTIACLAAAMYLSIWFDVLGAVVICGCIVRNWLKVHSKHNKRVHGHLVKKEVYDKLLEHSNKISKVAISKDIIAYYRGYPITVELYIECNGKDFHETADIVREHFLKFEGVQTVHVFPFDPRKESTIVEDLSELESADSCNEDSAVEAPFLATSFVDEAMTKNERADGTIPPADRADMASSQSAQSVKPSD